MISFNPRLLDLTAPGDGKPHLLGSHCAVCGETFFPSQSLCTTCLQEGTLTETPLSNQGTIYSFTIVERDSLAPPGFKTPYAYGYIDLKEGVRVLSKIVDWTPETLKIGALVELVVEEINRNAEGEAVIGFRFRVW